MVNASVLDYPVTGAAVVGFVAPGGPSWEWTAVGGPADLAGPDDPLPDIDAEATRLLLRAVFDTGGGTHDDWTHTPA